MDPSRRANDKEHPEASRDRSDRLREIERAFSFGLDDDDDDGAAGGIFHHNLTSASSALQGLLRKLGAGLDDLVPGAALSGPSSSSHHGGSGSFRLKRILSGLRADGEDGRQVEALTQLCDALSIATEDSLGSFPVDSFMPVLVGLLSHEGSNPDIMLLAARAIAHLCEVLPSSCTAAVHYGAVPSLCARLFAIEYMDLAEQSLQALKKISQEHPSACLLDGALMAVLSYLDFFAMGVQRVALSTAANICKKLPSDSAEFVMEAVPLLVNLLNHHDSKVLDHASVCLTRIAEAFASSPDKLDELCNHGLISQAAGLISVGNSGSACASLSTSTYTGLICLLSTCANGSALCAKTLHLVGISGILTEILSSTGVVSAVSVSPAMSRSPEQIFAIVRLADELLPSLPQGTISLPISFNMFVKGPALKKSSVSASGKSEDAKADTYEHSAREKLLQEQPELLHQFGVDLLPVLTQVYGSSVNGPVRHRCLSVIAKLMYFGTADMIQSFLNGTNISSFLAGILAWKDPQVLIPALQIAEVLMEKLPGTFSKVFVREGVVHAVDQLIIPDSSCAIAVQKSSCENNNDPSSVASHSRRNRRHNSASYVESLKCSGQRIVATPLGSVEATNGNSSLRKAVSVTAKAFRDRFFSPHSGVADVEMTDAVIQLKNLGVKLNEKLNENIDCINSKAKGKLKASESGSFEMSSGIEEKLNRIIFDILLELSKGDGVSTFEFVGSGIVSALLNYFSCGTFSNEMVVENNLHQLRQQALKRFSLFIDVALPAHLDQGNEALMSVLVRKLQCALSSVERFPVVLSHTSRSLGGSSRLSSGLSVLSQPFKLRLCRAQGDKSLHDYSSNIVLIDPLASLASVEEFLWPRVQRSDSGHKPSISSRNSALDSVVLPTSSTRSRSSSEVGNARSKDINEENNSTSKGKGKAVLRAASDEKKNTQRRNASQRSAASGQDSHKRHDHGNSSSEDELEISPSKIDEAMVLGEDDATEEEDHDEVLGGDSLLFGIPEKVHDVRVGDSADDGKFASSVTGDQIQTSGCSNGAGIARGAESADLRNGSSFGSRGMSFAAAAMAGLASISGRGIRGGREHHGRNSNDLPKLLFLSGGKPLNRNLTIYQAIQRQLMLEESEDGRYNSNDLSSNDGKRPWGDVYTITYQKADNHAAQTSPGGSTSTLSSGRVVLAPHSSSDTHWKQVSLLDSILQGELPCDVGKSNSTYSVLALLRVLESLNQIAPRLRYQIISDNFAEGRITNLEGFSFSGTKVSFEEFINSKLTSKLARQLQDALALCSGSLPAWCHQLTKACPFLFPFETRRQFFYSTAFGLSRALHYLQQQQIADSNSSTSEREARIGRLQRQKVRVSRNRILDSAAKVMEMYSSQKAVLEVEYFGEVGTGLGPTLEFYTLLSHELQKVGLQMWRSNFSSHTSVVKCGNDKSTGQDNDSKEFGVDDLIQSPLGLFPRSWPLDADLSDGSQFSKVLDYFRLLGQVMAKALQDGRLLDLPLSVAFYKLVLGQELDLHDILLFDAEFGKTLQEMQMLVNRKRSLEANGINSKHDMSNLNFRGSPIEDLYLEFTLPGYSDYVLKKGEDSMVGVDNLEDYISLVVDATVKIGIMRQMEAFKAGFNQVFDISSLQIFSPEELDYLLCGRREMWKAETLVDHIKFDHGYTAKSPVVVNLLDIMGEFTPEQQRAFCQFVTGAPKLPPGGLAALNPKLTIVKKHSSATNITSSVSGVSESADNDLPSVMTCANYLKLPPYSTKEIMYRKLVYAITEGQGSFDLS